MRTNRSELNVVVILCFLSVGIGCRFLPVSRQAEIPEETFTAITKQELVDRLKKRGVESAPARDDSTPVKPNPLTLQIEFLEGGKTPRLKLNAEIFELRELIRRLEEIFRQREEYGFFKEGSNEIEKEVLFRADDDAIASYNSRTIYIEDVEKLVDELRKAGIDQIKLDTNGSVVPLLDADLPSRLRIPSSDVLDPDGPPPPPRLATPPGREIPKIISGGVLNGKAINLIKPAFPPAARAVRASGTVNVEIVIDENGDVERASAVSGHPLLRAAAASAARGSKFQVTMLSGKPVKVSGVLTFNFIPDQ